MPGFRDNWPEDNWIFYPPPPPLQKRRYLETVGQKPDPLLPWPHAKTPREFFEADPYDIVYALAHRRYLETLGRPPDPKLPWRKALLQGVFFEELDFSVYLPRRRFTDVPIALAPFVPGRRGFPQGADDDLTAYQIRRRIPGDALQDQFTPKRTRQFDVADDDLVAFQPRHRIPGDALQDQFAPRRTATPVDAGTDDFAALYQRRGLRDVGALPFAPGRRSSGVGLIDWLEDPFAYTQRRRFLDTTPSSAYVDPGPAIIGALIPAVKGYDLSGLVGGGADTVKGTEAPAIIGAQVPPVQGTPR